MWLWNIIYTNKWSIKSIILILLVKMKIFQIQIVFVLRKDKYYCCCQILRHHIKCTNHDHTCLIFSGFTCIANCCFFSIYIECLGIILLSINTNSVTMWRNQCRNQIVFGTSQTKYQNNVLLSQNGFKVCYFQCDKLIIAIKVPQFPFTWNYQMVNDKQLLTYW